MLGVCLLELLSQAEGSSVIGVMPTQGRRTAFLTHKSCVSDVCGALSFSAMHCIAVAGGNQVRVLCFRTFVDLSHIGR